MEYPGVKYKNEKFQGVFQKGISSTNSTPTPPTVWIFSGIARLQHMRCAITHARLCTCLKHWRQAKKACLVWLRKLQGVRHITPLKQKGSLSFTFCKKQKSFEKIMCTYLFYWFSGENCIIRRNHWRCFI